MQDEEKLIVSGEPAPFLKLLSSKRELKETMDKIEDCILRSFGQDAQREPFKQHKVTQVEVKHRFGICERWIRRARGDLKFSMQKTLDLMQHALRSELDGKVYDPDQPAGRIWTPT